MHPLDDYRTLETRRQFFSRGKSAIGYAALSTLLGQGVGNAYGAAAASATSSPAAGLKKLGPHFPAKAKNVIYLHMVGGPAQMDLYDYKPEMAKWYDKDLPDSIRKGQRLTTMTSGQARFPIAPSKYKFARYGKCGMWVSEMLPETAKCVDEMCFIRSLNTEAINHEPAITAMQTGSQVSGRPCFGSWAAYGLGSANENLPTFVVLVAVPTNRAQEQAISAKLWSSGFLPGHYTGVSFRSKGDPILYINNPAGVPDEVRRRMLDSIRTINEQTLKAVGDPETQTRIQQYEMAFRMQASVPELTSLADETEGTFKLYGDEARKPGSLPNSMLMARRLVERGVRFVQIYHNNWDHHSDLTGRMPAQAKDLDRATYGLIHDLKQRGMFDETLIIWGGEFGRTIYSQGGLTKENYGRDHHPRCFTMWMAGGGAKGGAIYGETDEFSYNIVKDPVHIRDFHATTLQLLGFNHEKFTYKHQGLDFKLSGVEPARVVKELIA